MLRKLLFVIFLALSCPNVWAEIELLPDNLSAEDVTALAQEILQRVPNLATGSYALGLTEIRAKIQEQLRLQVELKKDPKYVEAAAARPTLLTFKFTDKRSDLAYVIRELPPHIAILRGAIGNDCSTSRSWSFPNSPYERNFWIESLSGQVLGYISGTITTVNGRPNLFLRDIIAHGREGSLIQLVVYGFYNVRHFYGAETLTLASSGFSGNNGNRDQQAILKTFDPISVKAVSQQFPDAWLRGGIFQRHSYRDSSYDSVGTHTDVRLIQPPTELNVESTYLVELLKGGVDKSRLEEPAYLWEQLIVAQEINSSAFLQKGFPNYQPDWNEILATLNNAGKLSVNGYYESILKIFAKYSLPASKNLMKKHSKVLLKGHLNSKDAFSPENERESVRFLTDILWRSHRPADAEMYVRDNLKIFENNEIFARAIEQLFERKQEADVNRVKILWNAGFRFQRQSMNAEAMLWLALAIDNDAFTVDLLEKYLDVEEANKNLKAIPKEIIQAATRLLDNDEAEDEGPSIRAARVLYLIEGIAGPESELAKEVKDSVYEEDNLQIIFPFAIAYLRDGNHEGKVAARAYKYLTRNLKNKELPANMRKHAIATLKDLPAPFRKEMEQILKEKEAKKCEDLLSNEKRTA